MRKKLIFSLFIILMVGISFYIKASSNGETAVCTTAPNPAHNAGICVPSMFWDGYECQDFGWGSECNGTTWIWNPREDD